MLLYEKEREILQQALLGVKPFPTENVIDILVDYGVTTIPSTLNMKQLMWNRDDFQAVHVHNQVKGRNGIILGWC